MPTLLLAPNFVTLKLSTVFLAQLEVFSEVEENDIEMNQEVLEEAGEC